jgi:hypothetical protein
MHARGLTLMGVVGIHWDIKPGEAVNPVPATKIYACTNRDCEKYQQSLKYNVEKQEWK